MDGHERTGHKGVPPGEVPAEPPLGEAGVREHSPPVGQDRQDRQGDAAPGEFPRFD